jgi:hypothetical protein
MSSDVSVGPARSDGTAIQALAKMGVRPAAVRAELLIILRRGDRWSFALPPGSPSPPKGQEEFSTPV